MSFWGVKARLFQVCVLVLMLWNITHPTGNPNIVTEYGKVMGKQVRVKESDRIVYAYLGIPFAEPPVDKLRFAPPQPPKAWNGTRNATAYPPLCLQNFSHGKQLSDFYLGRFPPQATSEDCLYLNIYTPVKPAEQVQLPVMVWIHGGGFVLGGASLYDGSSLAAFGNVVVVLIQYRLGILGFLSTGDSYAPGNVGLLDQVAALQWLQENIQSFGGDPKDVTLFGESAGSTCVSLHVLSPLSSGLFHKAISESGVAFSSLLERDPKPKAQRLARSAGCSAIDSVSVVECFRNKTSEEIARVSPGMGEMAVTPVLDGIFLPKEPEELLQTRKFNRVPYLLGINNHEVGWLIAHYLLPPGWKSGIPKNIFLMVMAGLLQKMTVPQEANGIIAEEYLGEMEDPVGIRDALLDLLGDLLMVMPAVKTARYHRDAGLPVYLYEFQHRPSVYGDSRPEFVKADHFDEVGFVFGAPFWTEDIVMLANTTKAERQLSKTMMAYWTNFAKNGDPNGDGLTEWPLYKEDEVYMGLNLNVKPARKLRDSRVKFWLKTFPEKMAKLNDAMVHAEL
ncbi:fatty acyl-CoA hydrolase precursor, medium chain-like isoform X1 [Acipenser ruthenus]|uniref:fatty acyl-CoA hydrolase precursor, medium chain-like isoform X1 n=1 Tax=Acipenser ruthenus TaxID=7906 RepID=UPI00145B0783|nr:fatty acyl-CoA hydrolase precursor, medium chain-like isoform X1 [Acipenser ruthenus]